MTFFLHDIIWCGGGASLTELLSKFGADGAAMWQSSPPCSSPPGVGCCSSSSPSRCACSDFVDQPGARPWTVHASWVNLMDGVVCTDIDCPQTLSPTTDRLWGSDFEHCMSAGWGAEDNNDRPARAWAPMMMNRIKVHYDDASYEWCQVDSVSDLFFIPHLHD